VQLADELGRPADKAEIARRLGLKPRKVRTIEKALRIYNAGEVPTAPKESVTLADDLLDTRTSAPDSNMRATDELRHVLGLLDKLPEREATILRLRFGLTGEEPMTLIAIGRRLSLTRERVRQLEREALQKLQGKVEAEDL